MKYPWWWPHERFVEDHKDEVTVEPTGKEAGVTSSSSSDNEETQPVITYEYRDEANRPWWKYFSEYEYRITSNEKKAHKWWKWFDETNSPQEKKLLIKLDILLTFYSFVLYWVKYLDQTNVNNAYVTNMKEDIGMKGNDLVIVQAMFTVGSCVFQLPFMYLFVHVPINIMLPLMDLGWGIFTLFIYKANNVETVMALRFFVGVFESSFYPAIHYLLGAWYKPSEYGRRGGVYYFGQMLGVLTSGLLQSATYDTLDGVNGLAGWRWMFIVSAIITLPVGIIGFWALPGTPNKCYSIFLTDDEIRLARKRMLNKQGGEAKAPPFFDKQVWKRIIFDWKIYILTLFNIFCWNNNNGTSGSYLLWIKSLDRYAPGKVNQLSAISPGLGILWIFLVCTGADMFQSRYGAIVISQIFNFIGNVILAVWDVPEGAKWFAFMLQYFGWAMASVLYGWMADICRHDHQVRAVVLVFMNVMAQASTAWISVLVWPTVESPRYLKGFSFTATSAFCLAAWSFVVLWFYKREERQNAKLNGIIVYNSKKGEYPDPEADQCPAEKSQQLQQTNN
jgi:MFS family permease